MGMKALWSNAFMWFCIAESQPCLVTSRPDEMVNLDKRALSSAPWGGDPSVRLAPVRLALL